jgi:hypothetical protein
MPFSNRRILIIKSPLENLRSSIKSKVIQSTGIAGKINVNFLL